MRKHFAVTLAALGTLWVLPITASANYCVAGGDTCPSTGGLHNIKIHDWHGTPINIDAANTFWLGTWSGLPVACLGGSGGSQVLFLYDEDEGTGEYLDVGGLYADSAICWGEGNDTIAVATGSFACAGVTLGAFDYGDDYLLEMHGQSEADHLTGGAGSDRLCGGSNDDLLIGGAGNDSLDGLAGDDTLRGGTGADDLWGYDGEDCVTDNGGGFNDLNGEGGEDPCVGVIPANWVETDSVDCGGNGGATSQSEDEYTSCDPDEQSCSFICGSY
jgi:Ca2+-binding RTX toxin-like protein